MRNKKIIIPVIAAAIAAAAIGTISVVNAESFGHGIGGENHEEMRTAIENDDYSSWKDAVNTHAEGFSSEENFNNMKQIHNLMEEGEIDEARQMREDLGMGMKGGHREEMQVVRGAVENKDYEAWKTAMEEKLVDRFAKIETELNEDTFNQLVKAHEAMQAGDIDEARQIKEDLGLPIRGGKSMRGGMGMGGFHNQK